MCKYTNEKFKHGRNLQRTTRRLLSFCNARIIFMVVFPGGWKTSIAQAGRRGKLAWSEVHIYKYYLSGLGSVLQCLASDLAPSSAHGLQADLWVYGAISNGWNLHLTYFECTYFCIIAVIVCQLCYYVNFICPPTCNDSGRRVGRSGRRSVQLMFPYSWGYCICTDEFGCNFHAIEEAEG